MLRTFFGYFACIIVLIILFPLSLIILVFMKKGKYDPVPKAGQFIVSRFSEFLCRIAGCQVEISGSENLPDGPCVFVGNHQSLFDTLLINYTLGPLKIIMSKKENFSIPLINIWLIIMKTIKVDRHNIKKAAEAMKQSEDYAGHGFQVLFFPEGTRTKTGVMGPFKMGAFKTAIDCDIPIVPFAIDGAFNVHGRQKLFKKSKVCVSILKPVYPEKGEERTVLAERTKAAIQAQLDLTHITEIKH